MKYKIKILNLIWEHEAINSIYIMIVLKYNLVIGLHSDTRF